MQVTDAINHSTYGIAILELPAGEQAWAVYERDARQVTTDKVRMLSVGGARYPTAHECPDIPTWLGSDEWRPAVFEDVCAADDEED